MPHNWPCRRILFSISLLSSIPSLLLPFVTLTCLFIGKRSCVGESLARMELFIFLVILLKDFTFSCIGGPDSIDLCPQYSGFANLPRNYEIIATPRWRGFTYLKKMYIVCRHLFLAMQFVGFLVCILDLVLVLLYFSDIKMKLNKIGNKISPPRFVQFILFWPCTKM